MESRVEVTYSRGETCFISFVLPVNTSAVVMRKSDAIEPIICQRDIACHLVRLASLKFVTLACGFVNIALSATKDRSSDLAFGYGYRLESLSGGVKRF